MSDDFIDRLSQPASSFDRTFVAIVGFAFQAAEVMLVVGAFAYAGEKTGSRLLTWIGFFLTCLSSALLGLLLSRMALLLPIKRRAFRFVALALCVALGTIASFAFTHSINVLAGSQN